MNRRQVNSRIPGQDIRTPKPVLHGVHGNCSYLVMEYLPLIGHGDENSLGQSIAKLHKQEARQFGWTRNNYIGSSLQQNKQHDSWADFWLHERLQPQWTWATQKAGCHGLKKFTEDLFVASSEILTNHNPPPSLLHGDLWSGNKAYLSDNGEPVIFDPASYYGDRETDIALSELFGGFDNTFYAGYNGVYPLPDAYSKRKPLYNLYHMLNHLNLFGQRYLASCMSLINKVI